MDLENIDENTSIEKDLGFIKTRFSDTLACRFRYSPKDGGTFEMTFIPKGRGTARTCSLQATSFKAFVLDILNPAGDLFREAMALAEKQEAESESLKEAIRDLTE